MAMRKSIWLAVIGLLLPVAAFGDFNPADYEVITQADLVKSPESHMGKKYQVTDVFQFCGSDFCVQIQKTKIDTRQYYCITLGPLCLVRMYVKKDHPEVPQVLKLKKGDKVTAYGTFDHMGSNYNYLVLDKFVVEPKK
jgi:hypothetical protein